jgi:O-antigen ligase
VKKIAFSSILIALVLLATLLAELYRFHGFLILDLITPPLILVWFGLKLFHKETLHWPRVTLPAALFLLIGFASLLLHSTALSTTDFLASAFYGVRWASLFFLCIIVANQTPGEQKLTWKILIGFTVLLCIAGFVQLVFVPNFTAFEDLGWDPHQGRLLSTWFDPNFVGGYLAFFTPLLLGYAWDLKKDRPWALPALGIIVVALALTLSRSAYVALFVGLLTFGALRSVKLLAIGGIALTLLGLLVGPVRDRVESLIENVQSVSSETYTLPDASARLRYDSWRIGWTLFRDSPLLGQGYNAYKFAALDKGLIKDPNVHAASGSDSSVLTILSTTGILGFLAFLSVYALLFITAWKKRRDGIGLGLLSGLTGLLIHSIFVNSLLFPLFMAPFWISCGLLLGEAKPSSIPPQSHEDPVK